MIYIILFLFGSCIGSFLNVLIYRMPREEDIGLSRSRCPHCKNIIKGHDNVPLISYIILKGRCRNCSGKISIRYFIVEFLTACSLCLVWWHFGDPVLTAAYFIFISLLIVGSFIDFEFLIIPDSINVVGIIVALLFSAFYPAIMHSEIWWRGLLRSLAGILISGGSLYIIAVSATALLKKEAMGMGDVKLLAMIGAFIGWKWALFTIFTSSFIGTIAGLTMISLKKVGFKGQIPFGPYLSMGAVISLIWGQKIINWYLNLFW